MADESLAKSVYKFISSLNSGMRESFWFLLVEQDGDDPDDLTKEQRDKLTGDQINTRKKLLETSLQRHSGLQKDIYNKVLQSTDWVSSRRKGDGFELTVNEAKCRSFLNGIDGFEIEKTKVSNSVGKRWYLRLGPKNNGYNSLVHLQVLVESFIPPRMKTIDLTSFC